jgi:putative DNA primase/helicase
MSDWAEDYEGPEDLGGAEPWEDEPVKLLPGQFKCTDMGNAERLVARHRGDILWSSERKRWLVWNGREWEWDNRLRVERMAKATARGIYQEALDARDPDMRKALSAWAIKSEGREKWASMMTMARHEVPVLVDDLDKDPWLLNCKNGTLDLRTGELREHKREDLITKTTGVDYVERSSSVLWERVLLAGTGGDGELAAYLQRVAGYACAGVATERKFFFLQGAPGTGKSTMIDALHAALGGYARSTSFDTWLMHPQVGGNRPDLVDLQGLRMVTSGEVKKGAKWDTALIKGITGGDRIKESAKYENAVEFTPCCTIVLAANDLPRAADDDDAFWKRMQRIPFSRVIPEEEMVKELREQLRSAENASAILAWAVAGCLEWQRIGIGSCPVVSESTAAYRRSNDTFQDFLESCAELVPGAMVWATDFTHRYKSWCEAEGMRTRMTTRELAEKFAPLGVRRTCLRGKWLWQGIQFQVAAEPDGRETFSFGTSEA